jgi:hypothetical protein
MISFTRITGTVLALMILLPTLLYAAQDDNRQYYFDRAPFVPPRIIEDLSPWESDKGEQVVAVNILESVGSNRYFGDLKTIGTGKPFVFYEKECDSPCSMGAPGFGYWLIGTTPSGVTVLFTESSGGGTGRFRSLLFVSLENDKALSFNTSTNSLALDRVRLILKKLGEITLGDRYEGDITLHDNTLKIGKDRYPQSAGLFTKDKIISITPSRAPRK